MVGIILRTKVGLKLGREVGIIVGTSKGLSPSYMDNSALGTMLCVQLG